MRAPPATTRRRNSSALVSCRSLLQKSEQESEKARTALKEAAKARGAGFKLTV